MTSAATPAYRKKLIEVDLPLAAINKESAREKSLRHGHPSTLHLWWARRPLAACRAVVFASMVDDPSSLPEEFPTTEAQSAERQRLHAIIEKLVVWEHSNDEALLSSARWEIARSVARSRNEAPPPEGDPAAVLGWLAARAPAVYDPFCGGGSIPLEAQRLGLRAVGTDLNPVAVLITKALIELPPKFANRPPVNPDADPMGMTSGKGRNSQRLAWRGAAGLADDIRWYGRWMRERAWERIGHLYPPARLADGGEATVIAWLWARTVPCPNPACGVAMPLVGTFQLSTKAHNQYWTRPVVSADGVAFEVQNRADGVPDGGTVDRNGAVCLACGTGAPLTYVREQARDGPYYDNISYAELSDFFYVWLRPALRDIYPELFAGILVPIEEEMVATPRFENPDERFTALLDKTLHLIKERCTPEFPSSIFYAYKQQEEEREGVVSTGWDTMLTALVQAGFQIVGTWPMRTERSARSVALGTNSLATSVVLVCRPRPDDAPVATRQEFFAALDKDLPERLGHLTREGHIAPVDLAQAAIGPGMEVYSRYAGVETIAGEPVTVREALGAINRAVDTYHHGEQRHLDAPSRFCAEWLRQHGMGEGQYGDAQTLARAHNVEVEALSPQLLTSDGGRVLLQPIEADVYAGDPRQLRLGRITAWEGAFRMARALDGELGDTGAAGAAAVARAMGSEAGQAERLARILYAHFDGAGDSRNAVRWNRLAAEWRDIEARAASSARQVEMGLGG